MQKNKIMKRAVFFLVTFLIIFSCSKDESGNIILPSMSAHIDGEEWTTITRVTVLEEGKFIITGTSTAGKSIVITVFGTSEGLYELNLTSANVGAVYKESVSTTTEDAYISATGEVNVTNIDTSKKKISGSFNFIVVRNLTNTINITGGVFTDLFYTITSNSN